jgi:hypothetical protein
VHNITNFVVMNTTANALLALGASPVMAHAVEEVEEMAALARALVINIGTLSPAWVESMRKAMHSAAANGRPIVFDPVGAGATRYRTETCRRLLEEVPPSIVRGNASGIRAPASAFAAANPSHMTFSVQQIKPADSSAPPWGRAPIEPFLPACRQTPCHRRGKPTIRPSEL